MNKEFRHRKFLFVRSDRFFTLNEFEEKIERNCVHH